MAIRVKVPAMFLLPANRKAQDVDLHLAKSGTKLLTEFFVQLLQNRLLLKAQRVGACLFGCGYRHALLLKVRNLTTFGQMLRKLSPDGGCHPLQQQRSHE